MTSLKDLETSLDKTDLESEAEASLREGLELREGMKRLGYMSAIKSLNRNMKIEDNAVERDIDLHQTIEESMWDQGDAMSKKNEQPPGEEDPMELMAARDIVINPKPDKSDPSQQSEPQPPPKAEMTPMQKAAVAAAIGLGSLGLLGGGFTAGALLNRNVNHSSGDYEPSDYDLGLLPADEDTD